MKISYNSIYFSFFRIFLGIFTVIYTLLLIPYGTEIYSNIGMIPTPEMNTSFGVFPKILLNWDEPNSIMTLLIIKVLLGILLIYGKWRPVVGIFLWFISTWLLNRNIYTSSPETAFIIWLYFAMVFIPTGESLKKENLNWRMPPLLINGAWFVLGCSYSYAGYTKWTTSIWRHGTAIKVFLSGDAARSWVVPFAEMLPDGPVKFITWSFWLLEFSGLLFVLIVPLRNYYWIYMTLFHGTMVILMGFAELSLGMILFSFIRFTRRMACKTFKNVEAKC